MSFDINPNRNLSNVQASSKTTAGGGGNTGYFQRNQEEEPIEFAKDYPEDSFEKQGYEPIEEESLISIIKNLILDFINSIKNFFTK